VPKAVIVKLAKKAPNPAPPREKGQSKSPKGPVLLAPCAQAVLLRGVDNGHRNEALFTLAKHLRNPELSHGDVLDLLTSANERCTPPMEQKEVAGIVKSVFEGGYSSLGCEDQFIASLCGDKCPIKKKQNRKPSTSAEELLARAEQKPTINPAQAFHPGILWYGQKVGRECLWVNSEREAFIKEEICKQFTLTAQPTESRWSPKSIKAFIKGKVNLNPGALFSNLRKFISRRIRFQAPWQATVVTLWVMGTYVYRIFDWYGYLWLTSPGRRAGKSRLLEIISALAYNATPLMTDPTEASLFRETPTNSSTQVLDEVESLKSSDQEKRATMMSVLNAGFKAGSSVPRFNNNKNRIEYHETFCPRVLAGIHRLSPTLADRCFRIFLRRKLTSEKIEKFSERKRSKYLQAKRNNLHKFGLLYARAIAKKYSSAESLRIPKKVDDRARDILEPLFAIAAVLDQQDNHLKITEKLMHAAELIARDRATDEGEDEVTVATLEMLRDHFPDKSDEWDLTSLSAMGLLSKHQALEWVQKRNQAASLLRQLGFRSGTHRNRYGRVVRAYRILKRVLHDLCDRYGVNPLQETATER